MRNKGKGNSSMPEAESSREHSGKPTESCNEKSREREDFRLLRRFANYAGSFWLCLLVAGLIAGLSVAFSVSVQAARLDLCKYVIEDQERFSPGASAAQVRVEWRRCTHGGNTAAHHHLYYFLATNIFQRVGAVLTPLLAFNALAGETKAGKPYSSLTMVMAGALVTCWGIIWHFVLGQGFNSWWERPLLLIAPGLVAYAFSGRRIDSLLPGRTLGSDWVSVALAQLALRWMYTEAFSTPFLLKNPLNYRALLFRVVLHPLVCALFLEAVKHVLFKTATKTSRALFVLATETVFIRAVVDRLLVDMMEKIGNILLVQAVLSASRVAARVLIRDSETRWYRVFYGERASYALTCSPQHNRDACMLKQMESIMEFVGIVVIAVNQGMLNVKYEREGRQIPIAVAAAVQVVMELITQTVVFITDTRLHGVDYKAGMSWLWKKRFVGLFLFLVLLNQSLFIHMTSNLFCPFDDSVPDGVFATELCPPYDGGKEEMFGGHAVKMLMKPENNYDQDSPFVFNVPLKHAVPSS